MLFFLGIALLLLLLTTAAILVVSSITNAPYLPSDKKSVAEMVRLANVRPGEKMVDLGSGDGRIVIAMAKVGAEAHGYELNLFLVWWSRHKIKQEGLSGKVFVHWKSFWHEDLGRFQIVTMFTIPHFMARLAKKMRRELRPGARFISNGAPLPGWQYKEKNEKEGIYLYQQQT